MREKDRSITSAVILLERAERAAEDDPAAAIPKLRKALEVCRDVGVTYLVTRVLADLGWTLALLGRLDEAESVFEEAERSVCSCSRPILDRRLSRLRDLQDRMDEAVALATRAADASEGTARGRALATLGIILYHAGDVSGSLAAFVEALAIIPVTSRYHSKVRQNLGVALADSDKLEDVQRAESIIRSVQVRFKGTKDLTVERANAAWALGQALVKRVQLGRLKGWERKSALCEARENVKAGIRGLGKRGLKRSVAAAQTDLAAIQALLDPFKVVDELEWVPAKGREDGIAFDLSSFKEAATEAAGGLLSTDQIQLIWQRLRELRQAIVEAGAARPIIIYEAP